MFKTEVINSRNIRKTIAYKVFLFVLTLFLLLIIALSFNIFGQDSAIGTLFHKNQSQVMQPLAIVIIILSLVFSFIMKSRMKNPLILGDLEMDEKGYRLLFNDKEEYSCNWNDTYFIALEFYSSANRNNPSGCMNYLNIADKNGVRTYEILIENSLVKADLGEFLRVINTKIPVKIRYTLLLKKILRDNDLKL